MRPPDRHVEQLVILYSLAFFLLLRRPLLRLHLIAIYLGLLFAVAHPRVSHQVYFYPWFILIPLLITLMLPLYWIFTGKLRQGLLWGGIGIVLVLGAALLLIRESRGDLQYFMAITTTFGTLLFGCVPLLFNLFIPLLCYGRTFFQKRLRPALRILTK